MNCQQARSLISRFLDRELSEDILRAFEDHLAACPACRQETEELRSLLKIIEKPADVPAPTRLFALIRERLPDHNRIRAIPWWKPALVPVLAAAAFILTAFASTDLITRIIAPPASPQLQVTSATMDLSVFHDAPQTTLAGAYSQLTGE
ncbi:MAG TPA: anti-sigma factor [bacterium]